MTAATARPNYIYRYRPLGSKMINDRELEALRNAQIWGGPFQKLNDPMEGLFRAGASAQRASDWQTYRSGVLDRKRLLGISSFSASWDNVLMWAHYTNGFRGMCIRYDFDLLAKSLPPEAEFLQMEYRDFPRKFLAGDLHSEAETARLVLSQKHAAWTYEEEWRLLKPALGATSHDPQAIRAIMFSTRVSARRAALLTEQLDLPHVQVHTTRISGYSVQLADRIDGA